MRISTKLFVWVLAAAAALPVSLCATPGSAQAIPAGSAAALLRLAARADVIFAGQVLHVSRNDPAGYVEVLFRVDAPVLGCSPGSFRLREWAGLWNGGAPRYVQGQRLLMLLRAHGSAGLSAPVGGMAGRIPLLATRKPPLLLADGTISHERTTQSQAGQTDEAVDLRWLDALEVRRMVEADPLVGTSCGDPVLCGAWPQREHAIKAHWQAASAPPSLSQVVALLEGMHVP